MLISILFLVVVMLWLILRVVKNHNQSKIIFERKINVLENIITELSNKLKNQEDKIKLSDDLRNSMMVSNKMLSNKILDMNQLMFEELFNKKA